MRQLNDSPSCLERGIPFDQFFLFASWADVGDESMGQNGIFLSYICGIKAEILRSILVLWGNHSIVQQRVKKDAIMPIGSADDE